MKTRSELISLKLLLFSMAAIFAGAAAALIILSTTAATVTGRTPAASIDLVHGANTGILGPGQQRWYRFIPAEQGQAASVENSLTLFFTPGAGHQVTMQLFEEQQLPFFYRGDTSKMANLGAGQVVSRDNSSYTGELFWTGWLFGQQSYYIQLANHSDTPIDYWLFTSDVVSLPLAESGSGSTFHSQAQSAPIHTGTTPDTALSLQSGLNQENLASGENVWYTVSVSDRDGHPFEEATLTMIVTPDDGHRLRHITFELFTAQEVQNWWWGGSSQLNNIGAGSVIYRDQDPLTGERIWSGWLIEDNLYYVRVCNGADVPVDYRLFSGDGDNPSLN